MADRHKTNKVPMSFRIEPTERARINALKERLGTTQVGLIIEAVRIYEEVLDKGIEMVAARRWQAEEEKP
jgi:predicted DNA-binding protein